MAYTDEEKDNLKRYLQSLNAPAEPSMSDQALDFAKNNVALPALQGVHKVLDTSDKYIGAPLRAGINEMQNVADKYQNEPLSTQLSDSAAKDFYGGALNAAKNQFGKDDRSQVPSGKQVFERAGLSGAGISDLVPGADKVFIQPGQKSRPDASTLDQIRPEKGGLLDFTPAGVAGGMFDAETDPVMNAGFSKIKGLLKGGKPEAEAAESILHDNATPEDFSQAVVKARDSSPLHAQNITAYSPEEYSNMKTFLSPDKQSGYAIKPNGELVSVFSTAKGRGSDIVDQAVKNGATHLDAFDINGKLPTLYGKHGFREFKREPNYEPGGPDVVYMSQPNNPNLSADDAVRLKEAELPKELQRTFPSQEKTEADPDQVAAIEESLKQRRYKRIKDMLDKRQKLRSINLDADTDKLNKAE